MKLTFTDELIEELLNSVKTGDKFSDKNGEAHTMTDIVEVLERLKGSHEILEGNFYDYWIRVRIKPDRLPITYFYANVYENMENTSWRIHLNRTTARIRERVTLCGFSITGHQWNATQFIPSVIDFRGDT